MRNRLETVTKEKNELEKKLREEKVAKLSILLLSFNKPVQKLDLGTKDFLQLPTN